MVLLVLGAVMVGLLAAAAPAAERFALPEFKSGYERPTTEVPEPRDYTLDWVDVTVLAVGLGVASYLAVSARSRRWIWLVMFLAFIYFGLWRGGCICAIGSVQNVTLGLCDASYAVPLVVIGFFLLPLVATLLFGRTFCAAVCPLGAIQDLVAARPVKVPRWLDHGLGLLAYLYVGAAVLFAATGAAFIICEYDPFVALFRLIPLGRHGSTMDAFPGSLTMVAVGVGVLALGVFVARPYCRWICPYGAVLRVLSRFSWKHVTITPDECIQCRLCEDSCPFGAIQKPNADEPAPDRVIGRRRLAILLVLVPVLLAAGGVGGWALGPPMARMHYTVRQADRVRLEEVGRVEGTEDISDAFYDTQRPKEELYTEAQAIVGTFRTGGLLLGVWAGLVVGMKLIHLSIYRRRTDYLPDRATCLSCGRCFAYCPVEQKRRKEKQAGKSASL
jgi:ferredoxin